MPVPDKELSEVPENSSEIDKAHMKGKKHHSGVPESGNRSDEAITSEEGHAKGSEIPEDTDEVDAQAKKSKNEPLSNAEEVPED